MAANSINFAWNKNLAIIAVANFCAVLRAAFHFPIMIFKHYPAVSFFLRLALKSSANYLNCAALKKNPVGEEKLNSIITLPSVNCESLGNMKRCFLKDVKHSKD